MFEICFQSQPPHLVPLCLGMALLIQAPTVAQYPNRDVCVGKELQGVSLVTIKWVVKNGHVEEDEPLPDNMNDSAPMLGVADETSHVATLPTKVAWPGEDLSSRSLARPGKDSSPKPSVPASPHPEAAPRGQQPYQRRAPSVGTKLLPEFKRVSMLLRGRIILRLQQWHELAANMGQQWSATVTAALVGAGVLILVLTLAALSRAQVGGGCSPRSDPPLFGTARSL